MEVLLLSITFVWYLKVNTMALSISFDYTIAPYNHKVTVKAHATTYRCDGTIRNVDIDTIHHRAVDITDYVSAVQGDLWDAIEAEAAAKLKALNNEG